MTEKVPTVSNVTETRQSALSRRGLISAAIALLAVGATLVTVAWPASAENAATDQQETTEQVVVESADSSETKVAQVEAKRSEEAKKSSRVGTANTKTAQRTAAEKAGIENSQIAADKKRSARVESKRTGIKSGQATAKSGDVIQNAKTPDVSIDDSSIDDSVTAEVGAARDDDTEDVDAEDSVADVLQFVAPDIVVSNYEVGLEAEVPHTTSILGYSYPNRFVNGSGSDSVQTFNSPCAFLEVNALNMSIDQFVAGSVGSDAEWSSFNVPVTEYVAGVDGYLTNTVLVTDKVMPALALQMINVDYEVRTTTVLIDHPTHLIHLEISDSPGGLLAFEDFLQEMLLFEAVG